jgi:hypothetical protein
MKYVIALIMLISIAVNGLNSYRFFQVSSYDLSSLLVVTAYLSIVLGIYALTAGKKKPAVIAKSK